MGGQKLERDKVNFCCYPILNFVGFGRYNLKKLTYEERKAKLIERLNALNSAAGADEEEEDDEDDE